MSVVLIKDITDQYQHTFRIIYEEIDRFQEEEWVKGFSFFQVPVKQAMHLFDCLDYYFRGYKENNYQWGHRFGGGWWELGDDQLPSKDEILDYARELEEEIMRQLSGMEDGDLSTPSPIYFKWAKTRLGLYIYALKHTLHHHGELAALSVYHGYQGGSWE